MTNVRIGVIGAGHLGRIHAKLLSSIEEFDLVAVAEHHPESIAALRQMTSGLEVLADYRDLVGQVDSVVIATPTSTHFEIAMHCLGSGIHCLIEKPMVDVPAEARRLVNTAQREGCVLQVGHVERFNPAWLAAKDYTRRPVFIEANRYGIYTGRSTDIGVIYDLMVHDLDLILQLNKSPVVHVAASSQAILGEHEDFAKATLTFADGCIAVLGASRIHNAPQRQMRVVTDEHITNIDFGSAEFSVSHIPSDLRSGNRNADSLSSCDRRDVHQNLFSDWLPTEKIQAQPKNAIECELRGFCEAIQHGIQPVVTPRQALRNVEVADQILQAALANREIVHGTQMPAVISAVNEFGSKNASRRKSA